MTTNTPSTTLCVDLDGTLVQTDTMHEAIVAFVRARPFALLSMLVWICSGRVHFKERLAVAARVDPARLPYNPTLIAFLREQQVRGRNIVLATASHQIVANAIAKHLSLFTYVVATDEENIKGVAKAALLTARYGLKGFAYAGDATADLPVWANAGSAILVNVSSSVRSQLPPDLPIELECTMPRRRAGALAGVFHRGLPWENWLCLIPFAFAYPHISTAEVVAAICAMCALSLTTIGLRVADDVLDAQDDRVHPEKWWRPFAAGTLSLRLGIATAGILITAAVGVSLIPRSTFALALLAFSAVHIPYMLRGVSLRWWDATWRAVLNVMRIYIGSLAVGRATTHWIPLTLALTLMTLIVIRQVLERCNRRGQRWLRE